MVVKISGVKSENNFVLSVFGDRVFFILILSLLVTHSLFDPTFFH
jgi:hypothetical protein